MLISHKLIYMTGLLLYPYFLVGFWYRDFLFGAIKTSYYVFIYTQDLLSVPLLSRTFFKPLKSEYREGLVFFSIFMGILIKSILLLVAMVLLLTTLIILLGINIGIILLPVFLIWSLFI